MWISGGAFRRRPHGFLLAPLLFVPVVAGLITGWCRPDTGASAPPEPTTMPMAGGGEQPDRLAIPILPESPTQVDEGRVLYYYHCMPCHGDRGQGLTDEWRQVWVEDHQNCWGRGCHTGREMAAFPIPRFVPPVTGSSWTLSRFQTADELFAFLRETQPPQRPGALLSEEYWALVAFLLDENGRLAAGVELGRGQISQSVPRCGILAIAIVGPLLGMLAVSWAGKWKRSVPSDGG